jgi:hypothetical protein
MELSEHVAGCKQLLDVLYFVLSKHDALGDENKSWRSPWSKLWKKITFGNSKTKVLSDIRGKLSIYTSVFLAIPILAC